MKMYQRNNLFSFFSLSVLLWVTACSPLKPLPNQHESVYTLAPKNPQVTQVSATANAKAQAEKTTLLVSLPTTHPEYRSKSMIYTQNAYQIDAFAKHRWVDKPAKMLQPLLVQELIDKPEFNAVVASPFAGRSDYRLDTEIIDFRQEFSGKESVFRITLLASLVDAKTQRIIASHQFSHSQRAASSDPKAGVVAANHAIARMLADVGRFVVAGVKS